MSTELRLPALEIRQGPRRILYSFAVDGKLLPSFVTVSRIRRELHGTLRGYQRPEVLSHISEIRRYIESANPMIPNAIVVAFDKRVQFEASDIQPLGQGYTRVGVLVIPMDESLPDEEKPGWIVDGQQRSAAIRDAQIGQFPISVTAFITEDDREQKEQFILVNSTKPLPKGLIYELLPATEARLPSFLLRRRFPAYLAERLNYDRDSPFYEMVQMPTSPKGMVKDNSLLRMLENSLTEGALHRYRDPETGAGEVEKMLQVLKNYWAAVRYVFADAWGLPPRRSRLMHGVGIVTMGLIMDAIMDSYAVGEVPSEADFRSELLPIRPHCCWTAGSWDFGPEGTRKWNQLQNTPKDLRLLINHLLTTYKQVVWTRAQRNRYAIA
jgi:DGQHR domain-containing protein